MLDAGYWMLVTASAKREAGYWILDVGLISYALDLVPFLDLGVRHCDPARGGRSS